MRPIPFSLSLSFAVKFTGIFIPIPDISLPTTDCPPSTHGPWTEAPARWSAAQKTSIAKQMAATSSTSHKNHNNKDVEVFESPSKSPSTISAASVSKGPLENLDGDKQPNFNIEIHNVFSFGDAEKTNENSADDNQFKIFGGQNKTVETI